MHGRDSNLILECLSVLRFFLAMPPKYMLLELSPNYFVHACITQSFADWFEGSRSYMPPLGLG